MAQHIDIAVVVSGDGDFAPAIRAVQQLGVRVEVVSFRGNTSSDLIEVADVFTDISQLARVEKGERSGRRVASEDDLSMTAVPEKETDNGVRRRRGEGRRTRPTGAWRPRRPGRPCRPARVTRPAAVPGRGADPWWWHHRRAARRASRRPDTDATSMWTSTMEEFAEVIELDADGRARACRRWRDREARPVVVAAVEVAVAVAVADVAKASQTTETGEAAEGEPREPVTVAPDAARSTWSTRPTSSRTTSSRRRSRRCPSIRPSGRSGRARSVSTSAPVGAAPVDDQDAYDDEPEIPEYLLAERRQQGRSRGVASDPATAGRLAAGMHPAAAIALRSIVSDMVGLGSPSAGGFSGGSGGNRCDRQPDRNRSGQRSATVVDRRNCSAATTGEARSHASGSSEPSGRPHRRNRGARCPLTSRRCCVQSWPASSLPSTTPVAPASPRVGDAGSERDRRRVGRVPRQPRPGRRGRGDPAVVADAVVSRRHLPRHPRVRGPGRSAPKPAAAAEATPVERTPWRARHLPRHPRGRAPGRPAPSLPQRPRRPPSQRTPW